MALKSFHAHLMVETGNGFASFAGIFVPIMLGQSVAAGTATAFWNGAWILMTLGFGGVGLFARALGKDLLHQVNEDIHGAK